MKNFFQNKIVLVVGGFAMGLAVMFAAQKYWPKPKEPAISLAVAKNKPHFDTLFDQFYNDDFFNRSHDPFEDMRKMREKMMKQFDEPNEGMGLFDSWYGKKFGGNATEIKQREDDKYVYYDISMENIDQKKLDVKVENGQINISAQMEEKNEKDDSKSYFSSSFHRSFPVPTGVDPDKVQMEQEKNRLVIKLPKLKSS